MTDFFHTYFPQIIGFFALAFSVIAFQIDRRKTILFFLALGNLLWSAHFFLLGAYTGAAMNSLAIVRNYFFITQRSRFKRDYLPAVFIVIFGLATFATWDGIISLLPFFGMCFGTVAFWQRKTKIIRLLSIISPPIWFTYNFINNSYAGMLVEVFVFSSICIAIIRYDILKLPEPAINTKKLTASK
jgi:hypothetical protein